MKETREYYCAYSFQTLAGLARGRDTFTMTGEPRCPAHLNMRHIREIETSLLETVRKKVPDATGLFLTWWTEIEHEVELHPIRTALDEAGRAIDAALAESGKGERDA